jgi:tRNA(Ile)-lysidine synthase
MDIIGAESDFMTLFSARIRAGKAADGSSFEKLPLAVQRRILRQELVAIRLMPEFELVEVLRSAAGKFVSVNPNLSVARDAAGKIQLRQKEANEFNAAGLKIILQGRAGRMEFGGKKISWAKILERAESGKRKAETGREFFDADKIGGEIILRHWRPGDRFQPIGMKSAVKLQDLFVNAKISAARRRGLVLATTAGGEIYWVEGLRIAEKFKLTGETKRRLRWGWSKIAG